MRMCWRVGGWAGCRGRRRTARIVCTRRAGRIRTGQHMRCGGAGRGGAVMWQPPSIPTVWPPGQVFAPRPCDAVPIRRVCGTIVVTAWRRPGGKIPAWTPTGSRSATTITVVRCRPGPVSRAPRYVGTATPTSRNPTLPRRLSTSRQTAVGYGVVSSPTSPPIQPPRVRNLLVRALRATPRRNKTPPNGGLRDVAHPPDDGGSGLRRDATTKPGLFRGPGRDLMWPGWGWHVAEQAALEVDRVVRLGRPVQNPRGLATHFARCFARPHLCHQRHQGACGDTRLNQHRGRRLDEQLETRSQSDNNSPTGPVSAPNPATKPGRPGSVTVPEPRVIDQAQLEAALARLPAPLAARLARLATRHRITLNLRDTAKAVRAQS